MPHTMNFPFRRVLVDHVVVGGTTVWWELHPSFREAGPYAFQLQYGRTGSNNAVDWIDVGAPVSDGFSAVDDQQRLYGKTNESNYRVQLRTPHSTYVSTPASAFGNLDEKDWVFAREVIRKERLLAGRVAQSGVLLKRLRYGRRCTRCLDAQTQTVTDSKCPECFGTGFSGGYHAPFPFMCLSEKGGGGSGESRGGLQPPGQKNEITTVARVLAFPMLNLEDVFVGDDSDDRWVVSKVEDVSAIRYYPLICDVTFQFVPYTDVIYRIPAWPAAPGEPSNLPLAGSGSIQIDHNYGGPDALTYQVADGCAVLGATILAFRRTDYEAGLRTPNYAVASTSTTAQGRWVYGLCLDPGDYTLVYEKVGEYGPDVVPVTVTAPAGDTLTVPPPPPLPPSQNGFGAY